MFTPRPAVLIVDDIEANLVALEAQLERLDCDIVRAGSGNEALSLLLKRDYAVILLDVQMPEMDGFEVARYARDNELTREVPIVFVTAMHETEERMLRGYGTGAIDVLFKPINPEVLRSKVRVFLELNLGRRRLSDEIEAHKATMRDLEAFNYSVSHDLRGPLGAIDGLAALLLEDHGAQLAGDGGELVGHIRATTARMISLVDDLLRLAHSSRTKLVRARIDLAEMARSIFDELVRAEPGRSVELVSVPNAPAEGDAGLMRIVLTNLLRNAWKFTAKKPHARIELGLTTDRDQPVYFVRDDGAGFDPGRADQLFVAFRRLHGNEFKGNGIGLAIVERIIRRHAGKVWAESSPGKGATFYFTLSDRRRT